MSCDQPRPLIIATPEQASAAFSILSTPADRIQQHVLARLAHGPAGLHDLMYACQNIIATEIANLIAAGKIQRFGGPPGVHGVGYRLAEHQP